MHWRLMLASALAQYQDYPLTRVAGAPGTGTIFDSRSGFNA
jgi:hypothetical protein